MKLLIVDVETTGLDPNTDGITEFGGLLYDVGKATITVGYNALNDPDKTIGEEAQAVSGITNDMVAGQRIDWDFVIDRLATEAEYIVAHRAIFDYQFITTTLKENDQGLEAFAPTKWLCSMSHIDWESHFPYLRTKNMNYMAADLGLVNPFQHRAIFDTALLLRLITHQEGLIDEMIQAAKQPVYRIKVHDTPFDTKDALKGQKYLACYVNGKFQYWWKDVPASRIKEEGRFLEEEVYGSKEARDRGLRVKKYDWWDVPDQP